MPTFQNLTGRPVLIRCNSGKTLHLPPRATSKAVPEAEVANNPKVEKLIKRRVIAKPSGGAGAKGPARKRRAAKAKKAVRKR